MAPNLRHSPQRSLLSMATLYIFHATLLVVFFFMSLARNIQYVYHKASHRFYLMAYYPNKLPQVIRDDVIKLSKIPRRVSTIVNLRSDGDENGGIEGLVAEIGELAAWCLLAGIPQLTVYEAQGAVTQSVPDLQRAIARNLKAYFGSSTPTWSLKLPHANITLYSNNDPKVAAAGPVDLEIIVLSRVDGKPTIVELAKTLGELAANGELDARDITVRLIDEELKELVGPEPDLLVSFGPVLDLQDYPPWHIRLLEIYWEPDNNSVNYAVFLRALQKFLNCKVNLGR